MHFLQLVHHPLLITGEDFSNKTACAPLTTSDGVLLTPGDPSPNLHRIVVSLDRSTYLLSLASLEADAEMGL